MIVSLETPTNSELTSTEQNYNCFELTKIKSFPRNATAGLPGTAMSGASME